MAHLNIEIKARCYNQEEIREILKSKGAEFKGIDNQIDTYFNVNNGRLKLRVGNIENSLIYYNRANKSGPKQSNVTLFKYDKKSSLKGLLVNSLGVLVVVDKQREIYFIDNVKFHLDKVEHLGNFVEIEAISNKYMGKEKLLKQCNEYMELFNIDKKDLIAESYSDMLLNSKY